MRTTLFGLIIVYTALAMPFCVWNMRAVLSLLMAVSVVIVFVVLQRYLMSRLLISQVGD